MNPYLISALETTPQLLDFQLRRIGKDHWDHRLSPDRFSVREVVAHLADWEPLLRNRIQAAVETPSVTLEVWDEGERALWGNYATSHPEEELRKLIAERAVTVDYVRSLDRERLQRTAAHPERGVLSASELAHMIPCHDLYHILQFEQTLESIGHL